MTRVRWIIAIVAGAALWAWSRVRSSSTQFTGAGSIADASTRAGGFLDSQLRTGLADARRDYQLSGGYSTDTTGVSNYQQVDGYCDPVGSTGIAFTNGQEYNVTCTRQGLNSFGTWMLGAAYSASSQQHDRDAAQHEAAVAGGTQFDR